MKPLTFRIGGIHVPECKFAPPRILRVDLPMRVDIPLKQHIGPASSPIVKPGDHVARGQKIAEACGKVGAPVHASISGRVTALTQTRMATGLFEDVITITAGDDDHDADTRTIEAATTAFDTSRLSPPEIIASIADAGVVGLGGATFPTAVKLSPPPGSNPEILVINAAECEPYLTCDNALMIAYPDEIIRGIRLMMRASGCRQAVIGIEDNKPQACSALVRAAADDDCIRVQTLRTKYPQGGEKQLVFALTGREIPSGALPVSVGAIVQNVATAFAVYRAVALRQPLIERVVTIDRIGNFLVPVGMSLRSMLSSEAVCACGRSLPDDGRWDVVLGGPMMGRSVVTLDAPITKGTSGLVFLSPMRYDPDPCIRCGACVEACPMGLQPYLASTCGRLGLVDRAASEGVMDCIECGSCSYVCPSGRPVLDYIRLAKYRVRNR